MSYLSMEWSEVAPLVPNITEERGQILLEDVMARAVGLVPELADSLSDPQLAVARAVIRKAVARWADSGSGGVTTKTRTTGPLQSSETYEARGDRPLFYDSEIAELKGIFTPDGVTAKKKAFSVSPVFVRNPADIFTIGW